MRDQEDGGDQKERGTRRIAKETKRKKGLWSVRDQKRRGTKRIAKGTSSKEGQARSVGQKERETKKNCQGDQEDGGDQQEWSSAGHKFVTRYQLL